MNMQTFSGTARFNAHFRHEVKNEKNETATTQDVVGIGRHSSESEAFAFAQKNLNAQGQRVKSVSLSKDQ